MTVDGQLRRRPARRRWSSTTPEASTRPVQRGSAPWPARGLRWGSADESSASVTTESVTVLFTDIVGSTAQASGLAADAVDEFRRAHFSVLRQSVAEAGGTEV